MATYISGETTYSDEDIERWAAEYESGEVWEKGTFGAPSPGRPIAVGEEAKPVTVRLDVLRREKLREKAAEKHVTISTLMRDLIDAL